MKTAEKPERFRATYLLHVSVMVTLPPAGGQDPHGDAVEVCSRLLLSHALSGGSACCVPGQVADRSTQRHPKGRS